MLWDAVLRLSLCPWGGIVDTGAVRYCLEVVPVSLRCYSGHRCCEVPSWGCPCVPEVLWWAQVLWGTVLRLSLCPWGVIVGTGAVRYRLEVVPVSVRCYSGHRCCEVPSWGRPCVPEVLWWAQVLWGTVLRLPLCLWGVMVGTGAVRCRLEVVLVSLRCYGGHRCCEVPSWGRPCVPEVLWWAQVLWGTVLRLSLCPWGGIVGTGAVRYRLEVVPVSVRCYSGHRCCEVPSWGRPCVPEVLWWAQVLWGTVLRLPLCLWGVMVGTGAVRCRLEVVLVSLRCYGGHRCCEVPSWGRPCVPEVLWWAQVLWGTVLRSSLCPWGAMVGTGAVRYRIEVVPVSLRCYSGHRYCEVPSWGRPCVPEVLWWAQVLWGAVLRSSLCPWGAMVGTGAVRYRLEVVPVSLRCYSGHRCSEVPSWGCPCVCEVL